MNTELKSKWIEALRSGQYDQCRDVLTDGLGGFCCIGVAYEISGKGRAHHLTCDDDDPTFTAAKALGLRADYRDTLISLNDGDSQHDGKSFTEIADYIEQNL